MRRNGCTFMCSVEGMRLSSGYSRRWNWPRTQAFPNTS